MKNVDNNSPARGTFCFASDPNDSRSPPSANNQIWWKKNLMPKKLDPDLVGKVEDGRLDCHHKCDPLVVARHSSSRLIWMWSIWHLVYVHDALHVHLEGGEVVGAPEMVTWYSTGM